MTTGEPTTGTVIDDRYKVLSRLGTGGMADVFLAEDQQLGRMVALKLLHRRFAEDPGFVERFRREAQSAAGLQHPNVVSVYDRGAFDDTYYIAMEYLEGRSLKQLIRQEAPLDPVRAIDITIQILKAARFAHRRGVIHRDLKPHNVIVGDGDHAKVTDFGIARAGASDMTETGSIMGTAQYLSPEQAQGHAVSAPSDLYSVGVVLYEMVTAQVPFDAESAVTIALKHVSEAPRPPHTINPEVPPELEEVILWSLNKNEADRPIDADQFITALEQAKEQIQSGVRGQNTASMATVGPAVGPGPATAAVPTALIPAAAAAGAYALADAPTSDGGPTYYDEHRDDRRRGPRRWPWVLLVIVLIAGGGVAAFFLTRPKQIAVPPVVNETFRIAQTEIQNAGFTPNVIYTTSTKASGIVIGQSPLGGQKVDKGSTVTLTVSEGPGEVTVPSVSEFPRKQAIAQLKQAGLKVQRILSEPSDVVPTGQATRTDPPSGTPLPLGSGVTLFVSTGKAPVPVPGVVGQTVGSARATLTAAGFKVTTINQPSSTDQPGTVISQSPPGNSNETPGTYVSLVVAVAPTKVKVPDVTGQTAAAAANTLTADGFVVTQKTTDVSTQTEDGRVISESPKAGGMVAKGSTVTIVVGKYKATTTTTPTTTTTTTTPTTTTPAIP